MTEKQIRSMSYGQAMDYLKDNNRPDADLLQAIDRILLMPTINAVQKELLLNAIRFLRQKVEKQEAMLKKACECILSGSSWETVCCTLTDKSQMNDDDWCDRMDCNTDEPVPIECAMHYLESDLELLAPKEVPKCPIGNKNAQKRYQNAQTMTKSRT